MYINLPKAKTLSILRGLILTYIRNVSTLLLVLALPISLLAQGMGINLPPSTLPNTMLDVNGGVSFREGTAWGLANGANNDIPLTNYSFFRVTGPTADFSVSGFTNGTDGRSLTIVNATSQTMTIRHQTGSLAANQINTGGSDINIPANGVTTMMYNATLTKWIVSGTIGNVPNFSNLTTGAPNDSLVVVDNGVPFKIAPNDFIENYAWGIDGNTGTVDGTHFLGTTDNIPLSFRVNNQKSGRISNSSDNTYFGYQSGNVTTGTGNTFVGYQVGDVNTSGESNTVVGANAFGANTGGKDNTAIGFEALKVNTGDDNTAVGKLALTANTSGQHNVAVGEAAMELNTTGVQNTALGREALRNNTLGRDNTALGYNALRANTTSDRNIAIGKNALITQSYNNGGSAYNAQNIAIGYESLSVNQPTSSSNGINNTAVGYQSGKANTIGTNNTFIGNYAGEVNTTGSNNVTLGYQSGNSVTTGSNNTLLGYQANVGSGTLTNATAIGNGASVSASNKVRIGNGSVTVIEGQVAYSFPSDRRLKKDIAENKLGLIFIKNLRPVHYVLKSDSTHTIQDGFIAQEVEATMNKLGITFSGLNKPQSDKDNYSIAYSTFVVPLVNAVKELDAKVEALTKESAIFKAKISELEALKTEVEKIKKAMKSEK